MALTNENSVGSAVSEMDIDDLYVFDDCFPSIIARAGYEGLMKELCYGFSLLMDVTKGLITFESLKRSAFVLGLHELRDEDIVCMLTEGDMDGDGALNQMEFCILMFRLSSGSTLPHDRFDTNLSEDMMMNDMGMPVL